LQFARYDNDQITSFDVIMAILGTLTEFPLPEVMLLLGNRTGILRLYDVPLHGHVEVEVREGRLNVLHIGTRTLSETTQILKELCAIVEQGHGMFEFQAEDAQAPAVEGLMPLKELVMLLIVEVDEAIARRQECLARNVAYSLNTPAPDIWIDKSLDNFLSKSRPYLIPGIGSGPLSERLGLKEDFVRVCLRNLCELGFLKEGQIHTGSPAISEGYISQERLVQDISELQKATNKLMEVCPRIIWKTQKRVTKWEQIALHESRVVAQYRDRIYDCHDDVRYTVNFPKPSIVILCNRKLTLAEKQQLIIDNINNDFQTT
jgi:hypothetical protein